MCGTCNLIIRKGDAMEYCINSISMRWQIWIIQLDNYIPKKKTCILHSDRTISIYSFDVRKAEKRSTFSVTQHRIETTSDEEVAMVFSSSNLILCPPFSTETQVKKIPHSHKIQQQQLPVKKWNAKKRERESIEGRERERVGAWWGKKGKYIFYMWGASPKFIFRLG